MEDVENYNIDGFVDLEEGMLYTLVVSIPKCYWYTAVSTDIILRSLTEENIRKVIEAFSENDAYWMKLYYPSGERDGVFNIKHMGKIIEEIKRTNGEIFGSEYSSSP